MNPRVNNVDICNYIAYLGKHKIVVEAQQRTGRLR